MNNWKIKKIRKQYKKATAKLAKSRYSSEIMRLAKNRDILGIVLILENIILIVLFFVFVFPLFR
ncbi:MAG: hypothetical protein FWH41_09125 [Treponema sp.]|nr:hypothetical protein [Treponema sp.]